ncbi:ABC transporter ATP-binding protein [Agrococcus sp. SGAir0287]|uniref:ABC transporter ATP-binding protein n=1 Tax=Agrococcus sp. SGAir0287 TaxID=2070347 RepID=UPI0010CD3CA7|nr:dipeptide ABC transporter ATP-binding protein [Agrococcus sp. SGAir0287]QCR20240.1 ABC transporter ATP-binding protein [Agrococcus sp. SGAir0287]
MTSLLSIEDLRVEIPTSDGVAVPVAGVDLAIGEGEMLGLVGESGSGKSMTAMSILRMLPTPAARLASGRILFDGDDVTAMTSRQLRRVRGGRIGTIFQEPMTALNPVTTIGDQITEPLRTHRRMRRGDAWRRGLELLETVGIREPERIMASHPFQLSGGMRQRAMIAMAMSCEPRLLIADEPTTALDVTTQAQILDLMVELQRSHGTAVLLITHDLGVVAQTCDRVAVMRHGAVVETAGVERLFADPQHPYTRQLLEVRPQAIGAARLRERLAVAADEPAATPLLEVSDLRVEFRTGRGARRRTVAAVDGVDLSVRAGSTMAIVGESGSGKTTMGRAALRLVEPTSGSVRFDGRDVLALPPAELRAWRREAQIVFQDTYASLDPRWKVGASLAEPLATHTPLTASERRDRVVESLELVGLTAAHAERFPHEFSGGQRQRVGIARALVLRPRLVVADEPVSALDVSVQAQVLELMRDLQERLGLTYLFITHDLSVVAEVADDVAVMRRGVVVEHGPVAGVLRDPQHDYTRALIAAVPPADPASAWSRERRQAAVARGLEAEAAAV